MDLGEAGGGEIAGLGDAFADNEWVLFDFFCDGGGFHVFVGAIFDHD